MKTNELPKMKTDEVCLLTALLVLELIILPSLPLGKYGGGIAMVAAGVVALPAYFFLFRERLRSRGQLGAAIKIAVLSIVVGAVSAALLVGLNRMHWP